jgi:hypothetical protein
MGTSLTGLTPATTYDALIKVGDNGPLSATAKVLSDGLGNDSVLALSTTAVGVGTTSPNIYATGDATNIVSIQATGSDQGAILDIAGFGTGFSGVNMGNQTIRRAFLGTINGGNFSIYTNPTNSGTSVTERLTITSAGNVGIGTSSPSGTGWNESAKILHINQNDVNGALLRLQSSNTSLVLQSGNSASYIVNITDTPIILGTNSSERVRVTNNGLTFNGDTAAANALDDYEEGTWTAVLTDGTTSKSVSATYTKIGRMVYIAGGISNVEDPSSFTGNVYVTGVPFTPAASVSLYGFNNYLSTASIFTPYLESNQVIRFYKVGAASADNIQMQGSDLDFYSDIYFAGQFTV